MLFSLFSSVIVIWYLVAASGRQCGGHTFKILLLYTFKNAGLLKKEESNTALSKCSSSFSLPGRICGFHCNYLIEKKIVV